MSTPSPDNTWRDVPGVESTDLHVENVVVDLLEREEPVLCEQTEAECPIIPEPPSSVEEGEWIMVFDTETTGLGPDYKSVFAKPDGKADWKKGDEMTEMLANGDAWDAELGRWDESKTYIAQISYIMYHTTTNQYKLYNKFISDIPSDVFEYLTDPSRDPGDSYNSLSKAEKDQKTHPITWATLKKGQEDASEKATIEEAMTEFISDFNKAKVSVAHNANYDRTLVFAELARLSRRNPEMDLFDNLRQNVSKFFCTLCATKYIVKINTKIFGDKRVPVSDKFPNMIKSPALWEVYDKMFGYTPDESALHDALVDVVVCLRVFYRLWMSGIKNSSCKASITALCGRGLPDIYNLDTESGGEITKYINAITPEGIDPEGNFNPELGLVACSKYGEKYARLPSDKITRWDASSGGRTRGRSVRKTRGGKKGRVYKKTRKNSKQTRKSRRRQ